MRRMLFFPVIALSLASPLAACGDGFTSEDAVAECDALRAQPPTLAGDCELEDEAHVRCVSCFETCGDECAAIEACPWLFSCPTE